MSEEGLMKCPFPPCAARRAALAYRQDPFDPTRVEMVYPIHDVEGPHHWFGRCPASQFMVPNLSDAARRYLALTLKHFGRQLGERVVQQHLSPKTAAPEAGEPTQWEQIMAFLVGGNPSPNSSRPERPEAEYFPGRPADAPEPGVGEAAAAPVPPGVDVTAHGRAAMAEDARSQLKQMVALANNAHGETQDALSQATAVVEMLSGILAAAEGKAQAAHALTLAAVGADPNLPEAGARMRANSAAARSTVADDDGIRAAAILLQERIQSAHDSAQAAVEAGREYAAIP